MNAKNLTRYLSSWECEKFELEMNFDSVAPEILEMIVSGLNDEIKPEFNVMDDGRRQWSYFTFFDSEEFQLELRKFKSLNFELVLIVWRNDEPEIFKYKLSSSDKKLIPHSLILQFDKA